MAMRRRSDVEGKGGGNESLEGKLEESLAAGKAGGTARRTRGGTVMTVTGEVLGPPVEEKMFDDPPAEKLRAPEAKPSGDGELEGIKRNVSELTMGNGFAQVVESFFDIPDPKQEMFDLRDSLRTQESLSGLSYGQVVDLLGGAQERAIRGYELVADAKITHERYKFDADLIEATLREKARDELEAEKIGGKGPTIADIEARMKTLFHDEMRTLVERKARAKEFVEVVEQLARRLSERASDLRQVVARVRRADDT